VVLGTSTWRSSIYDKKMPQRATSQDWNSSRYAQNARFVSDLGRPVLELLNPQPGERILDLGCGDGALTEKLVAAGAQVIGVDGSADMVDASRKRGLDARVMDAYELTFRHEFDAVFSNATLHWMPRADAVASGIFRALKPGGRFVAEFGGAKCVQTVRDVLQAELTERGLEAYGAPPWFFPTVPQYARLLEQAGFFVRSVVWFERPTLLAGEGGLSTWLELFCKPLLNALGEKRTEVVAGAERRCRSKLYRDGSWYLDYTRLRVVATKP